MNAEQVAQYLQDHPQFFEEHAELMTHLVVPHPHSGRAISITERQMLALREKNRSLESKMAELLQFGEENDAISQKMHRLAVALLTVNNFQSVLHTLNFHLHDDFAIPHVAVRLWHSPAGEEPLPVFAAINQKLQTFADALLQPYCGTSNGFESSSWFGEVASQIRSQALIALRNDSGTTGLLALGSEDSERFYTAMGTIYLQRLGEMLSAALMRAPH
ncbi:MAG TPA: DUF484 family protein [Accumulibacter sp.]|nr:DUF484 family protein [Accumulibacter sp.]HPP46543.1 DUF484 family protein [Accumulibacter sp.]